jgi:hypothetical protein
MTAYGYSYVSGKGFVAFSHDMAEGPWKGISIAKYDTPDRTLSDAALNAPHPVIWKLRITWTIAALKYALGSSTLDELDASWDSCQRKVNYRLAEHAESKDPEVRQAAERLRAQLLHGGGTGQTSFDYDEEVDFGRNQIELMKEPAAAADVKKLKMGDLLQEIADTTEALAKGAGRTPGTKRSGAPSIQQREALTACSAAFNGVHDEIAWFIENTEKGPDRDKLIELQAPFEALLARNPPRTAVAKATPPAAPAAPPPATPPGTTSGG